jgi:hypothetical protein
MVLTYLGKPGFLTDYVAQTVKDGAALDHDAAGAGLTEILPKAGMTPLTGLKTIAA